TTQLSTLSLHTLFRSALQDRPQARGVGDFVGEHDRLVVLVQSPGPAPGLDGKRRCERQSKHAPSISAPSRGPMWSGRGAGAIARSEEHTSELQSRENL